MHIPKALRTSNDTITTDTTTARRRLPSREEGTGMYQAGSKVGKPSASAARNGTASASSGASGSAAIAHADNSSSVQNSLVSLVSGSMLTAPS